MSSALLNKVLEKVGEPALKLTTTSEDTTTFLGGMPTASTPFDWPRKDGRALGFIGQIDLSELKLSRAAPWLPSSGRLLFFYDLDEWPWGFDPKDRGGWRVIYDRMEGDLAEVTPPSDLKPDNRAPEMKRVRGEVFLSIPSLERVSLDEVGITEDEEDDYYELVSELFGGDPRHQIGGFPDPVQGDEMEAECQLVSGGVYCGDSSSYNSDAAERLRREPNDWRLLLQFDSDDDLEVMWGDAGMLYFWIRESDARAGNFENVWMVLQCG